MAGKIDNIDLGVVTSVILTKVNSIARQASNKSGYSITQSLDVESHSWRINGYLMDATQASYEALDNARAHKLLVFIDCTDIDARLLGWGKVIALTDSHSDTATGIIDYELQVDMLPAIGCVRMQTDEAYLIDLLFRSKRKMFDPHFGIFNKTYDSNRLILTYEFYVANYKNTTQDVLLEIDCGSDIYSFGAGIWKNGAFLNVGNWRTGGGGGFVDWGAVQQFTDEGAVVHDSYAEYGYIGQVKTIGTISNTLGCLYRILFKIDDLTAGYSATHLSTKHDSYQLKMQLTLVHTARESLRPYPHITYIDGGQTDEMTP